MNGFRSGWYFETVKGLAIALQVDKILHEEKTSYHDIVLFKSTHFGSVLVVDGMIQCTERDEFPYHEMMAHLPLFSHPKPKKVLIIGGGDGGIVREVDKHDGVEEIHLCEIDERILELCKSYLPIVSCGLLSSKLKVFIEDIATFIDRQNEVYDVIIIDSYEGIDKARYQKEFCEKLNKTLKPEGIICTFGDSVWTSLGDITNHVKTFQSVFPLVQYAFGIVVLAYTGGQTGFIMSSKNKDMAFDDPANQINEDQVKQMNLKYYNYESHKACFVLPPFVKDVLEDQPSMQNP